jgi:hypothetical protein
MMTITLDPKKITPKELQKAMDEAMKIFMKQLNQYVKTSKKRQPTLEDKKMIW